METLSGAASQQFHKEKGIGQSKPPGCGKGKRQWPPPVSHTTFCYQRQTLPSHLKHNLAQLQAAARAQARDSVVVSHKGSGPGIQTKGHPPSLAGFLRASYFPKEKNVFVAQELSGVSPQITAEKRIPNLPFGKWRFSILGVVFCCWTHVSFMVPKVTANAM